MDQARGYMTSHAAGLAVRFKDNDNHHVAERPWTNQAISYAHKAIQRRTRDALKVFKVQKEGRPIGRNVVTNGSPLRARAEAAAVADDGLQQIGPRFVAGDFCPASDVEGSASGVGAPHLAARPLPALDSEFGRGRINGSRALGAPPAAAAPWQHITGEATLGAHLYQPSPGRAAPQHGAPAAALVALDQQVVEQRTHRAATAAVVARLAAIGLARATQPVQDAHAAAALTAHRADARSGVVAPPAESRAALRRTRAAPGDVQHGDSKDIPAPPSAWVGGDIVRALHAASPSHLGGGPSLVAAHGRSAAPALMTPGAHVRTEHLGAAAVDRASAGARPLPVPGDVSGVARYGIAQLIGPAAAAIETIVYSAAAPDAAHVVAEAQSSQDPRAWATSAENASSAVAIRPWYSATQGQTYPDATPPLPEREDGARPVVLGAKNLRAGLWTAEAFRVGAEGNIN